MSLIEPIFNSIFFTTSFFVFSKINFSISRFSCLSSCINILATSDGLNICVFILFIGLFILVANSHTAFICIALTLPIPLIFSKVSIEILASPLIFSDNSKILLAISIAVSSFVPVLIIIAKSSAFDNFFAPYINNFSYGLSDFGNCFILSGISLSFLPPKSFIISFKTYLM